MIEFISLFFGLASGMVPIELNTVGAVTTVELRLDGETIATLEEEPWRTAHDLGSALAPHELVAIARDNHGREIDRATQWINVEARTAEATMVFSGGERGMPRSVSLVWESIGQRRPQAVDLQFDGQSLTFDDPEHVPLPAYDPQEMHFVSATLHFRDETVTRLDAGFGGGRGSEITAELTAVAITLDKGLKLPKPRDLDGWFLKSGEPLQVHGVEKGSAEIIVVRDPTVQPDLEELFNYITGLPLGRAGMHRAFGLVGDTTFLRVLSPASAPLSPTEVTPQMFVHSASHDAEEQGVLWLTQQTRPQTFPMMFSNAVAVAGMQAHAGTARRAVVLLLGDSPTETMAYPPEVARDYLRLLNVPLFIWRLTEHPHPEWTGAHAVSLRDEEKLTYKMLRDAVTELRANLDAQRIVWLEGSHLPQQIELSPKATGIRLAGSG